MPSVKSIEDRSGDAESLLAACASSSQRGISSSSRGTRIGAPGKDSVRKETRYKETKKGRAKRKDARERGISRTLKFRKPQNAKRPEIAPEASRRCSDRFLAMRPTFSMMTPNCKKPRTQRVHAPINARPRAAPRVDCKIAPAVLQ